MKPEEKQGTPAMTARQERQQREAQALRANLMRRKQQQRSRPVASDVASGAASASPSTDARLNREER